MKNKLNPFVLLDTNLNLSYGFGELGACILWIQNIWVIISMGNPITQL